VIFHCDCLTIIIINEIGPGTNRGNSKRWRYSCITCRARRGCRNWNSPPVMGLPARFLSGGCRGLLELKIDASLDPSLRADRWDSSIIPFFKLKKKLSFDLTDLRESLFYQIEILKRFLGKMIFKAWILGVFTCFTMDWITLEENWGNNLRWKWVENE